MCLQGTRALDDAKQGKQLPVCNVNIKGGGGGGSSVGGGGEYMILAVLVGCCPVEVGASQLAEASRIHCSLVPA